MGRHSLAKASSISIQFCRLVFEAFDAHCIFVVFLSRFFAAGSLLLVFPSDWLQFCVALDSVEVHPRNDFEEP
jgi:hypothetical protein